ncbi:MAG: response regulator transcription factor [Planctomycetota bacterium]|nr:response regulator transcription factor [Planctomycetota bacterium]
MNTNKTALVVEDESEIADLVKFHLEREGIEVTITRSGRKALELARKALPDLLVLDLMLPDLDGLEVCRRLKENDETKKIPVVMLTARGSEADIVAGIEMGADDYVTKPFSPRVLMARLQNALRKNVITGVSHNDAVLVRCSGKLTIDRERHVVTCNGETISLTITEFEMLFMLAKRPGFVRTRDQIISTVHGPLTVLSQITIDVHITAIRRKLQNLGDCIETVRGVGYRFTDGQGE